MKLLLVLVALLLASACAHHPPNTVPPDPPQEPQADACTTFRQQLSGGRTESVYGSDAGADEPLLIFAALRDDPKFQECLERMMATDPGPPKVENSRGQ